MEILHFKDLMGYSKCRHECSYFSARRVSNFNTNAPLGDIYLPIKLYYDVLELTMLYHFKVIADGQTHTHGLNTIVSQPLRGSTNNPENHYITVK